MPCYIVTYYVKGVCAVDELKVVSTADKQLGCELTLKNGKLVQLVETCAEWKMRHGSCRDISEIPGGAPIFEQTGKKPGRNQEFGWRFSDAYSSCF